MNINEEIGRIKGRREIISSLQKFINEHNNKQSGKALEILSELNDVVTMEIAKNQEAVTLIDKIVNSMGGLAGLLPGLILLMNKLWGDKIINGISSAAYNIAGLIPSVN